MMDRTRTTPDGLPRARWAAVVLAGAMAAALWAGPGRAEGPSAPAAPPTAPAAPPAAPAAAGTPAAPAREMLPVPSDYRLQAGDTALISVAPQKSYDCAAVVLANGTLQLPRIGV